MFATRAELSTKWDWNIMCKLYDFSWLLVSFCNQFSRQLNPLVYIIFQSYSVIKSSSGEIVVFVFITSKECFRCVISVCEWGKGELVNYFACGMNNVCIFCIVILFLEIHNHNNQFEKNLVLIFNAMRNFHCWHLVLFCFSLRKQ